MKTPEQVFGKNLKRLRKERRLTQEKLAELIDMHPRQISKLETGGNFPRKTTIEKICIALNIDSDELLTSYDKNSLKSSSKLVNEIIKKIIDMSPDENVCEYLNLAISALQNPKDLEKLSSVISGMLIKSKITPYSQ